MGVLSSGLVLHRLPPVCLGSGRTGTIHKFCAVLHAFFLESGTTASLQCFCNELHSVTTDFGVEFGLTEVFLI
jgi:hypothetical protein